MRKYGMLYHFILCTLESQAGPDNKMKQGAICCIVGEYNSHNRLGSVALVDLQSFKSILVLAAQKYHQSGKNNILASL